MKPIEILRRPLQQLLLRALRDVYLSRVRTFSGWFETSLRSDNPALAEIDRGEQRACREWLERHPAIRLEELLSFGWSGRVFSVAAC